MSEHTALAMVSTAPSIGAKPAPALAAQANSRPTLMGMVNPSNNTEITHTPWRSRTVKCFPPKTQFAQNIAPTNARRDRRER
jgi:hypothetical protein